MDPDSHYDWVDDTTAEQLLGLLAEHGVDVNGLRPDPDQAEHHRGSRPGGEEGSAYQIVPLRNEWLRIGMEDTGELVGRWISDPGRPEIVTGEQAIRFDEAGAEDLDGWLRARADMDGVGGRWVSVFRRPEREAYAAMVYDAGPHGPQRRSTLFGIYPDITLCDDDGSQLAFVEPIRGERGATRALLSRVGEVETDRRTVATSTNGGLAVRACSVRRFVKLSHGVRTLRIWELVDVAEAYPAPITVPGTADNPDLFDVALVGGDLVLVQAMNRNDHWEVVVSVIDEGEILSSWRAATSAGTAMELTSGDGCVLLRVRTASSDQSATEQIFRVPLAGFSTTGPAMLRSSPGLFSLSVNSVTPSVGFGALELTGGSPPYTWFFDSDGRVLNAASEIADRAASHIHRRIEAVTSDDGYVFELDVRWRGDDHDHFRGPIMLMVYGAYGLDIDLDLDRDLGGWLDRGFAVGTPHVRGGGRGGHLAGCRANRDRSLADLRAAVGWLRAGAGAIMATRVCLVGASAGGFLVATALNTCPDEVDVCVIVNGFVDPLGSLLREDTMTVASDQDEWGSPRDSLNDLEMLTAVSPVQNLRAAGQARALVMVSARDVRVNPRQGLKWYLSYRELGGAATLWYDPNGAHDCWGAEMDSNALFDWVSTALGPDRG